jgi:hypothetical protein
MTPARARQQAEGFALFTGKPNTTGADFLVVRSSPEKLAGRVIDSVRGPVFLSGHARRGRYTFRPYKLSVQEYVRIAGAALFAISESGMAAYLPGR